MIDQPMNSLPALFPLHAARGIRVIPAALIPQGHRFTLGNDCYIHPADYARMQPMSAAEMLLALGLLQKIESKEKRSHGNIDFTHSPNASI